MPLLAGWVSLGCGQDCPGIGVFPLGGEVRAKSGAPICAAQIRVTARGVDKTYECRSDGGTPSEPCCTFLVMGGPGDAKYTIEVTADGYAPSTTVVYVAEEDECGQPVPRDVTIELSPE